MDSSVLFNLLGAFGGAIAGAISGAVFSAQYQRRKSEHEQLLSVRTHQFEAVRELALQLTKEFDALKFIQVPYETLLDADEGNQKFLLQMKKDHSNFLRDAERSIKRASFSVIDPIVDKRLEQLQNVVMDGEVTLRNAFNWGYNLQTEFGRAYGHCQSLVSLCSDTVRDARELLLVPEPPSWWQRSRELMHQWLYSSFDPFPVIIVLTALLHLPPELSA